MSFFGDIESEYKADNTLFFNEVRESRLKEIAKRKESYNWKFPFKIYPSMFHYGMCPVDYIVSLTTFSGIDNLVGIYRVKRGSAVHTEFQDDFKHSKRIYPYDEINQTKDDYTRGLWPEVGFYDKATGVSGRADGIIKFDCPVPIEIKTTSVFGKLSEEEYPMLKELVEQYENNGGRKLKKNFKPLQDFISTIGYNNWWEKLPMPQHICQGAIYCEEFNRMGFFDKEINKFILAYVNLVIPPGDTRGEKEFVMHYDEELKDKTCRLLEGLSEVRSQYMSIKDFSSVFWADQLECTYKDCRKHAAKKVKE